MNEIKWNLDDLYLGFDDKYKADMDKFNSLVEDYTKFLQAAPTSPKAYIEGAIKFDEELTILYRTLASFASLSTATDVTNNEALGYLSKLSAIYRKLTAPSVTYNRYLANVDLDELAKDSDKIKLYLSNLKNDQKDAKHLLTEKEEVLYAKLAELSSMSWSRLQQIATANLKAEVQGKEYTFSDLRGLAYDFDQKIRKEAYEKELAAFESVDDFVAMGLTNIKREVNTMMELRGYKSALEKTLDQSRMSEQTLNAMIEAMKDYRPHFARYMKAKAKYLGHEGGLPWYDMFAPVGQLNKTYSYEEAQKLVVNAFGSYSAKLANFAQTAFDKNWIDVFPKKGKRGGAFCSNQPQLGQSRIMLNFTGSLDSVSTMAHELGHGYHGDVIKANQPLHWSYPMPLAETASIFFETIMTQYLLTQFTDPKERLSILEVG